MRNLVRSAALLLAGAVLGIGLTTLTAQTSKVSQVPPPGGVTAVNASTADARQMIPGSDLALRVESREAGRVVGTLVTKVGDQWVEVELATRTTLPKLP